MHTFFDVPEMLGKRQHGGDDHYCPSSPRQKRRCIRSRYTIADIPREMPALTKPAARVLTLFPAVPPVIGKRSHGGDDHDEGGDGKRRCVWPGRHTIADDPKYWTAEMHLRMALRDLERRVGSEDVGNAVETVKGVLEKLAGFKSPETKSKASVTKRRRPLAGLYSPSKISRHLPKRSSPLCGRTNGTRDLQPDEEGLPKQTKQEISDLCDIYEPHFLSIHERVQQGLATRFQYEHTRAYVLELRRRLRGPRKQRSEEQKAAFLKEGLAYHNGGLLKKLGEKISSLPATAFVGERDKLPGNAINKTPRRWEKSTNMEVMNLWYRRAKVWERWEKEENEIDFREIWETEDEDQDTEDEDPPEYRPAVSKAQRAAQREHRSGNRGLRANQSGHAQQGHAHGTFSNPTNTTAAAIFPTSTNHLTDSVDLLKFRHKASKLFAKYCEDLDLDEDIEDHACHLLNQLRPNAGNQTTRAQVAMCIIEATPTDDRDEIAMLMLEDMGIPKREFLPAMRSTWWASQPDLDEFRQTVLGSAESSSEETMKNLFGF
ncbi:MAG: hypothetical protein Q9174_005710 [Haloplaca sp. 1 TL-2023]